MFRGRHEPTWVEEMDTALLPTAVPMPGTSCVTRQGSGWKTRLSHSWNNPNHILFWMEAAISGGDVSRSAFDKRIVLGCKTPGGG